MGIESAFVADADGVGVVMLGVCADGWLGAAGVDGAVLGDVVVVADGGEAACLVAGFKGCHGEVLGDAGGGAVDDDEGYCSHFISSCFQQISRISTDAFCFVISRRFHRLSQILFL